MPSWSAVGKRVAGMRCIDTSGATLRYTGPAGSERATWSARLTIIAGLSCWFRRRSHFTYWRTMECWSNVSWSHRWPPALRAAGEVPE